MSQNSAVQPGEQWRVQERSTVFPHLPQIMRAFVKPSVPRAFLKALEEKLILRQTAVYAFRVDASTVAAVCDAQECADRPALPRVPHRITEHLIYLLFRWHPPIRIRSTVNPYKLYRGEAGNEGGERTEEKRRRKEWGKEIRKRDRVRKKVGSWAKKEWTMRKQERACADNAHTAY